MRRTTRTRLLPALAAVAFALPAATAAGAASPGGTAAPAGDVVLTSGAHAIVGRPARLSGYVPAGEAGRTVRIELHDEASGAWLPVVTAVADAEGAFAAQWRSAGSGRFTLRAVLEHGDSASAATNPTELGVTVYKPAIATWYGPGFYGRRTACGQRLTRTLVGVAHRTLPCGTLVAVLHRGRSIVAPVVDRGPFGTAARWDLTVAAAQAVGFTQTGSIGALRLAEPVAP
jgi:hypothetical protein